MSHFLRKSSYGSLDIEGMSDVDVGDEPYGEYIPYFEDTGVQKKTECSGIPAGKTTCNECARWGLNCSSATSSREAKRLRRGRKLESTTEIPDNLEHPARADHGRSQGDKGKGKSQDPDFWRRESQFGAQPLMLAGNAADSPLSTVDVINEGSHETRELPAIYVSKALRVSVRDFDDPSPADGRNLETQGYSGEHSWRSFVKAYRKQISKWANVRHTNVVGIYDYHVHSLNLHVEYCSRGSVREYIKARPSGMLSKHEIILAVLRGLKYLHSRDPPIIHGGLNAGKVFVNKNHEIKIGEFGLTGLCYQTAPFFPSISFASFSRWMSPELLDVDPDGEENVEPTLKSDIWALGCTIYEIVLEELPYSKYMHDIKIQRVILNGELPGDPTALLGKEPGLDILDVRNLVISCWSKRPTERPAAGDLVQFDLEGSHENREVGRQAANLETPSAVVLKSDSEEAWVDDDTDSDGILALPANEASHKRSMFERITSNAPRNRVGTSLPTTPMNQDPKVSPQVAMDAHNSAHNLAAMQRTVSEEVVEGIEEVEGGNKQALASTSQVVMSLPRASPAPNLSLTPAKPQTELPRNEVVSQVVSSPTAPRQIRSHVRPPPNVTRASLVSLSDKIIPRPPRNQTGTMRRVEAPAVLQTSRSTVAGPKAAAVTIEGVTTHVSVDPMGKAVGGSGSRGLRLQGRPQDDVDEEGSIDEEDWMPNEFSKTYAQRRLEALATRARVPPPPPMHQVRRSEPDIPTPAQQPQTTMPYGMDVRPTGSPRTVRRKMIAGELSESLRRNLMWERTSTRFAMGANALGSGSRPLAGTRPGIQTTNSDPAAGTGSQSGAEDEDTERRLALGRNES